MDKRYNELPLSQQLTLRKQAVDDVLANPSWPLHQVIRHLKTTMRLTAAEFSVLAGVSLKTLQNLERGDSAGNVQSVNRVLGVLGLRLGVVRDTQDLEDDGA